MKSVPSICWYAFKLLAFIFNKDFAFIVYLLCSLNHVLSLASWESFQNINLMYLVYLDNILCRWVTRHLCDGQSQILEDRLRISSLWTDLDTKAKNMWCFQSVLIGTLRNPDHLSNCSDLPNPSPSVWIWEALSIRLVFDLCTFFSLFTYGSRRWLCILV